MLEIVEGGMFGEEMKVLDHENSKFAHFNHSICLQGEDALVVTGSESDGVEKQCEIYDFEEQTWFLLPTLNEKRMHHSSCAYGESKIYVFAGFNKECLLNSIECFDRKKPDKGW